MFRLGCGILLGCLCTALPSTTFGDSGGSRPGILQSMTAEQYRAAGLHKLTEQELEVLSVWLRKHATVSEPDSRTLREVQPKGPEAVTDTTHSNDKASTGESAPPVLDENFGLPEPREAAAVLQAEILPPFRGWNGKTVFQLDNGQVWKQRVSGKFTYSGDDRRVVISQNSWGFYEMRLVDADRSVGVRRLK